MFGSWLKSRNSNLNKNHSNKILHAVLKTPLNAAPSTNEEEIIFACGCFWGAEKSFWKLPGVVTTAVGYAGGDTKSPTYNQVCTGKTGHTEVVRVVWDNSALDLSDLLKMFWECHDPTQGNRQGNDCGTQYRSAIYTYNEKQKALAIDSLNSYQDNLNKKGYDSITTEIKSDQAFYFAEEYHQQYLAKPGNRPYCSAMPTNVPLKDFPNATFKLEKSIWESFDWGIKHCVLRSNNEPIQ
mgnify:CR=1 FL=1